MGTEMSKPKSSESAVWAKNPVSDVFNSNVADIQYNNMYSFDTSWVMRTPWGGGEEKSGSKEREAGEEEEEVEESRITKFVDDYAGSTSFHGIAWTRNADTIFGRLVWLLIVLGMTGFLIYQIYDRVSYYRTWPVTVDIKINVADELIFPAVTICNTNTFRLSRAVHLGLYRDVTRFYESSNNTYDIRFQNDSRQLFEAMRHDKKGFIKECTWMQTPCGPDHFTRTWTDAGICYTFNGFINESEHKKNNYLKSPLTGPKYGLRVTLNIESYESMAGPSSSAGVKVLPHDQIDPPLIEDFATSVPPRMSAFIGINLEKARMLEPPYGNCTQGVKPDNKSDPVLPHSRYLAEQNCYAEVAKNVCSCVLPYMPPNGSRYCNFDEMKCVQDQIIKDKTGTNECRRLPACVHDIYHTQVAYSAMSDFSAIRTANDYSTDGHMLEGFKRATVLRHKLMPMLFEKEKYFMGRATKALHELNNTLNSWDKGIATEIKKWRSFMDNIVKRDCLETFKMTVHSTDKVRSAFAYRYGIRETANYLQNYQYSVSYGISLMKKETNYVSKKGAMKFDVKDMMEEREKNRKETRKKKRAEKARRAAAAGVTLPPEDPPEYVPDILFHAICAYWKDTLEDGNLATSFRLPKIINYFQSEWDLNKRIEEPNFEQSVWRKHAEEYGEQLVKTLDKTSKALNDFSKLMNEKLCPQLAVDYEGDALDKKQFERYLSSATSLMQTLSAGVNATMKIAGESDDNLRNFNEDAVAIVGYVEQYAHTVSIRLDATEKSLNAVYEDFMRYILPIMEEFNRKFNNLLDPPGKTELLHQIKNAVPNVKNFQDKFSTLYKDLVADTSQLMQQVRIMHDVVLAGIKNIEDRRGPQGTMNDTKDAMAATVPMADNMDLKITMFARHSEDFREYCRELLQLLERFAGDLKLSAEFVKENFIEVRVYYQSLAYTQVDRQKAYDGFSLLCDSGGTAGLYIGCSFISIIELFYFLVKHCLAAISDERKKRKEDAKTGD